MKPGLIVAALLLSATPGARADAPANNPMIARCITSAAGVYLLPPAMLVILLTVEGGSLGRANPNTNGTVDIGPMQVNQIWLPALAAHWQASPADTYRALRDNFCANVEAGAWILRQGLNEAHGDFWLGVGYYHSHNPVHSKTYLRAVWAQVQHLATRTRQIYTTPAARVSVAQGEK